MDNPNTPGYLHGESLQAGGKWAEFTLTIKEAIAPNTVKAADGKLISKAILVFENAGSHFILGNTNERLVKCQLGTKPKEWIGQRLTLYPVTGNWFGVKNAIAVRVRISEDKPKPFIQPKNMGTDITGRKVQDQTKSKPVTLPDHDLTDYSEQPM